MTWSDPIVDEVRKARDAYAARFNYDLRAIYRDLKEQEKLVGLNTSSSSTSTPVAAPNDSALPAAPDSSVSGNLPTQSSAPDS